MIKRRALRQRWAIPAVLTLAFTLHAQDVEVPPGDDEPTDLSLDRPPLTPACEPIAAA